MTKYPIEELSEDEDDGTMPDNVSYLMDHVVGHKIVSVEHSEDADRWGYTVRHLAITLDNGKRVRLVDVNDCCAGTELQSFLLHHDTIDHVITGVGTTGGYTHWHIYADFGDVLELHLNWGCGNPFYYAYGFDIRVEDI